MAYVFKILATKWDTWVRKNNTSENSGSENRNPCGTTSRRLLPLPPDKRIVLQELVSPSADTRQILQKIQAAEHSSPKQVSQQQQKAEQQFISPENTTIIGDSMINCFRNPDSKWLVQCFDKATRKSSCVNARGIPPAM